jgi:hypothetical protein
MTIYCTYLTVYRGNKLPPFYIGYSTVKKIEDGYHGTVLSKAWKDAWKAELDQNPHLFKTTIISQHESRVEAVDREQQLQRALNVLQKPEMYLNRAIGRPIGTGKKGMKHKQPRPQSYRDAVAKRRRGTKMAESQKLQISKTNSGRKLSEDTRAKMSRSKVGVKKSPETRARMAEAQRKRFTS